MSDRLAALLDNPNVQNYLSMISQAEGTAKFADPYRVAFGGKIVDSLDDHPNLRQQFRQTDGRVNTTSAAGKYQFQKGTWDSLADRLGLKDFGPRSQDLAAVALLEQNGSLPHVVAGDYDKALARDGKTWASLPTSTAPQNKQTAQFVKQALGQGGSPAPLTDDGIGERIQRAATAVSDAVMPAATAAPPVSTEGPSVDRILAGLKKAKAAGDNDAVAELTGLLRSKVEPAVARAKEAGDDSAVQELSSLLSDTAPTKEPTFDWAAKGRSLYKRFNGKEFKGDDAEATKWLKQEMSDLNNNFFAGGIGIARAKHLDDAGKKDLLEAMDAYDKLSVVDVLPEIGQSLITDPTNVLTLGLGKVFTKTGQAATKEAVKRGLRESLGKSALERATGKVVNAATGTAAKMAAEGAVYGAGSDAITQNIRMGADGQDGYDVGQGLKSASIGALLGGGLGKLTDVLGGTSSIEKIAKRAGSEEGTRVDAEITKQLAEIADNPNFRGQEVRAEQFNQVAQTPINDVKKLISIIGDKELAANGLNRMELDRALNNWKSLTPDQINALRGTGVGDSAAAAIERAQRVRSLTAETTASGGVLKAARALTDVAPLPGPVSRGLKAMLGSGKSRKAVGQEVVGQVKTANRILDDIGGSNTGSTLGLLDQHIKDALEDKAKQAAATQQAKAAAKAQAASAQKASNFEKTDLFKTVSKAVNDLDNQAMDAAAMQMGSPDIDAMRSTMAQAVDPAKVNQTTLANMIAEQEGSKEVTDALATQIGSPNLKDPAAVNRVAANPIDKLVAEAQNNAQGLVDPRLDGGQAVKNEIANILSEGKQSTKDKVRAKRDERLAAKQAQRAEAEAQNAAILRNGQGDLNTLGGGSLKATIDRMAGLGIDAKQTQALIQDLRNTTEDKELQKVLDKLLNNKTIGSKKDKLLYKIQDNILVPHAQKLYPDAVPNPAFTQSAMAQASREVDAKGNPIRSRPAYEQGAKANQKVYSDAKSAINDLDGVSSKAKTVAKDIIDDLRTGSPSKAMDTLMKVQTKLSDLGAEASQVEPIIMQLIEKFYQQ